MRKRDFDEVDIQTMLAMRDKNYTLGVIAKHFKTNKPSILKALKLWDSGEQVTPDGRRYLISRGKAVMLPDKVITPDADKAIQEEMEKTQQALQKMTHEKN